MKLIYKFIQKLIVYIFFIFYSFIFLLFLNQPSVAQLFPDLDPSDENLKTQLHIPVFYRGNLEIAPVFLDGREISTVESFRNLNTDNSNDSTNHYGASARSHIINNKLQKILNNMTRYGDEVLPAQGIFSSAAKEKELRKQLVTSITQKEGTWVVLVTFPKDDVPEIIFSVTQATIEKPRFGGSQPQKIAQRTANLTYTSLIQAWQERQSAYLIAMGQRALMILGILIIISGSLVWGQKILVTRGEKLGQILANMNQPQSILPDSPQSSHTKESINEKEVQGFKKNRIKQSKRINSLYKGILFWTQWLVWLLGIGYITYLFYWSRPFSNWIMGVSVRNVWSQTSNSSLPLIDWLISLGQAATLGTPLLILLLLITTRLVIKVGDALSNTFARTWIDNPLSQRHSLRVNTLAKVFRGWLRVIIYVLLGAIIAYHIHQLGAVTQMVAVLLGFISFALSLASQNLLQDLISGLLILWEDQYAVGDVILVGEQGGLVENITLRVTQLRNLDGELITIPNRTIDMVRNLSSEWSRVNYSIEVNYDTDIDQLLQVMEKVGQELYQDPQWQQLILESPEVLGIDEISHKGILIRLIIKTQPLQQWSVAREFRRRLKKVFDQEGIRVGIPQQKMYIQDLSSNNYQPNFPLATLAKE